MTAALNLSGQRFGRLTVIERVPGRFQKSYWRCVCDCGSHAVVCSRQLVTRTKTPTRSCGCLKRELDKTRRTTLTHGHTVGRKYTPTYRSWSSMFTRCRNPKHEAFHRYGGAGIDVCERWENFENFLADMGERPAGTTLDRIKNDVGYEPGNCRWATRIEQGRNRRTTKVTEAIALEVLGRLEHGERVCSIARRMGMSSGQVTKIKSGKRWPELQPVTMPVLP